MFQIVCERYNFLSFPQLVRVSKFFEYHGNSWGASFELLFGDSKYPENKRIEFYILEVSIVVGWLNED